MTIQPTQSVQSACMPMRRGQYCLIAGLTHTTTLCTSIKIRLLFSGSQHYQRGEQAMRKVIQFIKDVKWAMGGSITRYKLLYILLRFKALFLLCLLLSCLSG